MDRRPLARMPEKFHPHTVKMPDSLWARFTAAALAEGELNISSFVRECAIVGLEYRERDQHFRSIPPDARYARGNPPGRTAG